MGINQGLGLRTLCLEKIEEYREGGGTLRKSGDHSFEQTGVTHWWENNSEEEVVAVVVDILKDGEIERCLLINER